MEKKWRGNDFELGFGGKNGVGSGWKKLIM